MKLGILSDIHDNLWNLKPALACLRDAEILLCCGDLCSPFVIPQLATFEGGVYIVFGNNDADLFRITQNSAKFPNVKLHGEFFTGEFDRQKFAMNHFDAIARPLAESGAFDVVCFGHNHEREISRSGRTLLINPGPIMGARFTTGWEDVPPTFALYDTETRNATLFGLDAEKRVSAISQLP